MIIPIVNNARVYDGIVSSEIIGSKISPCENYLAVITKESLQILSNRHNRILISRFILNNFKEKFCGTFSGNLEWSNNSKLLILGSSSYQHVFVFRLHLHSPLEITNESGHFSESESSFEDSGIDSDEYDDDNDSNENGNRNEKRRDYIYGKNELENFLIISDSVSKVSNNDRFVFITEELENGLINIPSVNVPDEIFDSFQEDLLSFQLISEYGTLTDKNEKTNSETGIEFSTSYAKLDLIGIINVFYKFNSFLLIFDQNVNEYVLLFTLNEFPILILITISNSSLRRRNIFLTDLISFNQIGYEFNNNFQACPFSALNPIYNLELNKKNFFSGYLDLNIPNKEIKLENLERLNIYSQIQESIKELPFSADYPQNYCLSLMETLINHSNKGFEFSLENKPNFSGFGVGSLEYNEIHDWLTITAKPMNSLLLFSWNSPLSFDVNYQDYVASGINNDDQIINFLRFPFGFIIKAAGVLRSKILNRYRRIVTICDESLQLTEKLGIEFELCGSHIDDDSSFEVDFENRKLKSKSKTNYSSSLNQKELFIEVLSLEEMSCIKLENGLQSTENNIFGKPKINCIFSLKLSEIISNVSLFSNIPYMSVSNSDIYITITLEESGIFVIDSFSGKIYFKINKDISKIQNSIIFKHAVIISNDLSMLYQVEIKAEDEDHEKLCLIELPIYKLVEKRSSFCKLSNNCQALPYCENLIFLGMESIGVLQCNYRNFKLDFDSESNDFNNLESNQVEKDSNIKLNSKCKSFGYNNDNSGKYNQKTTPDFGGIISSCIEFQTDLLLKSIPIPPSIYINHNWPINEAYVNKSGNYILVSGYRGCAIYDLINSRWRLFCDLSHELLLCKPNLPFGWINEWTFFLSVDSSLLLNTFHDLITSNDDLWEVSAFEKNKLYETYIQSLSRKLKTIKNHQNKINNEEICIVFFDIRNSLDVRNIIGLIPFCSSCPLLVVNNVSKPEDDLFILYTDDFVLTAYEDESPSNFSFIPSEIKWVINLSETLNEHPVEILLIKKCLEFCIFLVLKNDRKLYKLIVYYQPSENILDKKCEFKFLPINKSCIEFDENLLYFNNSNIIKFGFMEFCSSCKNNERPEKSCESIEITSFSNKRINCKMSSNITNIDNILKDASNLLQDEFKLGENNIFELLKRNDLRKFVGNCLNRNINTVSDKLPLYWENIEELDIYGIIWYLTESQQIFLLPLIDEIGVEENKKYSPLTPILVQSFQTKPNHTHVINFFPGLASFLLLESYSSKKKINNQFNFESTISKSLSSLIIEPKIILKMCQSLSPVLQDLINVPNKFLRSKIIREFLNPIISYIKVYPLENILKILINIFENMLFPILKNSCKEYKKTLNEIIQKMVSFFKKNGLVDENVTEELICNYLKEIFYIVGPNLKTCNKRFCGHDKEVSIIESIQSEIMNSSPSIQEMIQLMEIIEESLEIVHLNTCSIESLSLIENTSAQSKIFAYLVISIIRKIDPVIAPCIIFPIIDQNPNNLFQQCIKNKNYSNAMLYLTILQSFIGPYFVRYEHSLLLLHNILSSINITNYCHLFPMVNQTIKFIFIIFKPNNLSIKTPLSKITEPVSIVGMNNCNNLQLDCLVFLNKIDSILEFHFLSKLIQIEWLCIIIMCKSLGMNFNSWFTHCLQKYFPLWFSDENLNSFSYLTSNSFFNLVISIQHKFNLFNVKENSICLFDETFQQNSSNSTEVDKKNLLSKVLSNNDDNFFSNIHKNNSEIFFQNFSIQNNIIVIQVIKQFFKSFLSNYFPLPALAIAYACNDVYSVHKVLHDFPNIIGNLHAIS
ncbi:large with central conserved domain [Cryptosporidium sp. chipmunk genotype I]|uniref:large with central conserved domain n=1 Tax=Cryptosporidium sp. chipmunk genotype I TaxID=1280935 RepID=UPI00351A474C|nr:large with central conserved domain [Cryptosporidium sp. chipmunk genotype I]